MATAGKNYIAGYELEKRNYLADPHITEPGRGALAAVRSLPPVSRNKTLI
jgi:hypothetical protein